MMSPQKIWTLAKDFLALASVFAAGYVWFLIAGAL